MRIGLFPKLDRVRNEMAEAQPLRTFELPFPQSDVRFDDELPFPQSDVQFDDGEINRMIHPQVSKRQDFDDDDAFG